MTCSFQSKSQLYIRSPAISSVIFSLFRSSLINSFQVFLGHPWLFEPCTSREVHLLIHESDCFTCPNHRSLLHLKILSKGFRFNNSRSTVVLTLVPLSHDTSTGAWLFNCAANIEDLHDGVPSILSHISSCSTHSCYRAYHVCVVRSLSLSTKAGVL